MILIVARKCGFIMKVVRRNLKKAEIVSKPDRKWYCVTSDEIRFLIDEKSSNELSGKLNEIDWKNNKGVVGMDSIQYSKYYSLFNGEYKGLTPKLFIKNDTGSSYNEYEIDSWKTTENGVEIIMK